MFRFVFVIVMASMFVLNHSFLLNFDIDEDPSYKFVQDICKTACNFQSRILFDDTFPPFVCGICKIKGLIPSSESSSKPSKPSSMKPPTTTPAATTTMRTAASTTPTAATETTTTASTTTTTAASTTAPTTEGITTTAAA